MKNTAFKLLLILLALTYLICRKDKSLNGIDLLAVEAIGLIGFQWIKLKL